MSTTPLTGYESFDELIRQLRAEGHDEAAAKLHALLHEAAWTTGSELMGELGLAILEFERSAPTIGSSLRRHLDACMSEVRRAWPDIQ